MNGSMGNRSSYRGDDVGGVSCCLLLFIAVLFACCFFQLVSIEHGSKRKSVQIEHRDR